MVKKGIYLMKSTELGNAVQNEFEAALNNEDNAELAKLMASKYNEIAKSIEAKFEELKDEHDAKVLASRGIRTLTSDEEKFYNRIFSNEVGNNPSRGVIEIMPKTIFDQVFDDLRAIEENNLLSLIDLQNTTGAQEWLVSIAESPVGAWGEITGAITTELSAGFKVFNTNVNKFSCYIPWAKSVIDLGAVWQDAYVRALLTLAIKNGLTIAACSVMVSTNHLVWLMISTLILNKVQRRPLLKLKSLMKKTLVSYSLLYQRIQSKAKQEQSKTQH